MRAPPATPPADRLTSPVARGKAEPTPAARSAAPFRAVLHGPAPGLAAAPSPASCAGRCRPAADAEPEADGRPPLPLLHDVIREPSPACFFAAGVTHGGAPASPGQGAAAPTEPTALAAVAERVLRSLRVGTDGRGRSLVLLDVAVGALAGCRIELRRVDGGIEVLVRDAGGAPDPRTRVVVDALRRCGIQVVS